jgi:hypothetical protein
LWGGERRCNGGGLEYVKNGRRPFADVDIGFEPKRSNKPPWSVAVGGNLLVESGDWKVGFWLKKLADFYGATKCVVHDPLVNYGFHRRRALREFLVHVVLNPQADHFRFWQIIKSETGRIGHGVS